MRSDIGNPPFGHFGEAVIRDWFEKELGSIIQRLSAREKIEFDTKLKLDFTKFDGNPQGFRILTRLIWNRDQHGLNFTATQLCAAQKYTVPPTTTSQSIPIHKKPGWFITEDTIANATRNRLGLPPGTRHPVAFIMEAADDIAYCLSDIEDGLEKHIYSSNEFFTDLKALVQKKCPTRPSASPFSRKALLRDIEAATKIQNQPRTRALFEYKTNVTRMLVQAAARIFNASIDEICKGERTTPILCAGTPERAFLDCLGDFAKRKVFGTSAAENLELSGRAAIHGLLDSLKPLLLLPSCVFEALGPQFSTGLHYQPVDLDGKAITGTPDEIQEQKEQIAKSQGLCRRLSRLLPEKHVLAYRDTVLAANDIQDLTPDGAEVYARMHLVVDFISGMTDMFAIDLHQRLTGNHFSLGRH